MLQFEQTKPLKQCVIVLSFSRIYYFFQGDSGYFEISRQNKYTGKITLAKDLDYDKGRTSFVLNISATVKKCILKFLYICVNLF